MYPFLFVFGVNFCSLSVIFLQMSLNFSSLLFFALGYATIFCLPLILFDQLLLKITQRKNSFFGDLYEFKIKKVSCILIVDLLLTAVSAFTLQSVTAQINFGSLLSDTSMLALTSSIILVSVLFIGIFSFIFYFGEPNK
jgi:hypothetical protein